MSQGGGDGAGVECVRSVCRRGKRLADIRNEPGRSKEEVEVELSIGLVAWVLGVGTVVLLGTVGLLNVSSAVFDELRAWVWRRRKEVGAMSWLHWQAIVIAMVIFGLGVFAGRMIP